MDILSAYFGLCIAFIIIASLLLYFIINSKAHVLIKAVIIPIVIWFTLVLYFTPDKLMGWPTHAEPPDGSIVLLDIIKEPGAGQKGFIDLLVIVRDSSKLTLFEQLNPVNTFSYNDKNTERIYRLPYDRDLHKKLIEAKKKAGRSRGMITYKRGKKKPGEKANNQSNFKDDAGFKVINPVTIIPKDTE